MGGFGFWDTQGGGSGGGGGGASGVDDPTEFSTEYGSDLGYDEEFDGSGSALPTGWSWLNQGSTTFGHAFGAGVLAHPGEGSEVTRGIFRSAPTESSWTATAKIGFAIGGGGAASAGLLLGNSSSGNVVWFRATSDTNWRVTRPGVSNDVTRPMRGVGVEQSPTYFRLRRNSATSYDFHVSGDGLAWGRITNSTPYDPSGHVGSSPDRLGLLLSASSNEPGSLSCHWFRVR